MSIYEESILLYYSLTRNTYYYFLNHMLSYICFMHNKYTKDIESTCYIVQLKKNKRYMFWFACTATIVFRPGPVQDPGSGFWLGHRVARVNCFLKNQNDIILEKKNQRVATGFLTGLAESPGHTGFFLPLFFFNPVRFQIRVSPLGWAGFVSKVWRQLSYVRYYLVIIIFLFH